ncbi:hypothetical protein SNEBB_004842 [Seison nebaliae]|nr:hypothetical protein SNEBB_004842 [Seison nebaliae]
MCHRHSQRVNVKDYKMNKPNKNNLFISFLQLVKFRENDQHPTLAFVFPNAFTNNELIDKLGEFIFPGHMMPIDGFFFMFSLTEEDGSRLHVYCRSYQQHQNVVVFISPHLWTNAFFSILRQLPELHVNEHCSDKLSRDELEELKRSVNYRLLCLDLLYNVSTNLSSDIYYVDNIYFSYPSDKMCCKATNCIEPYFPSVSAPNLAVLFQLGVKNIIRIFSYLLNERRLLFVSHRPDIYTGCAYAAIKLLYPLEWSGLFIPLLPYNLIRFISAPMPYVIGTHISFYNELKRKEDLSDVVVINCDTPVENLIIETKVDDGLEFIPNRLITTLERSLGEVTLTNNLFYVSFYQFQLSVLTEWKRIVVQSPNLDIRQLIVNIKVKDLKRFYENVLIRAQSFERFFYQYQSHFNDNNGSELKNIVLHHIDTLKTTKNNLISIFKQEAIPTSTYETMPSLLDNRKLPLSRMSPMPLSVIGVEDQSQIQQHIYDDLNFNNMELPSFSSCLNQTPSSSPNSFPSFLIPPLSEPQKNSSSSSINSRHDDPFVIKKSSMNPRFSPNIANPFVAELKKNKLYLQQLNRVDSTTTESKTKDEIDLISL